MTCDHKFELYIIVDESKSTFRCIDCGFETDQADNIQGLFVEEGIAFEGCGTDEQNKDMDMNYYSEFLEDGDYEKFMPLLHNHTEQEKKDAIMFANRCIMRGLWIKNRFTKYRTQEWRVLADPFNRLLFENREMQNKVVFKGRSDDQCPRCGYENYTSNRECMQCGMQFRHMN